MSAEEPIEPEPAWSAVRELFERCLEDPPSRDERLAAATPALRREVESLLDERAAAQGRLEPDLTHRQLVESTFETIGAGGNIGPYRVLGVLGRGGMGVVFLAEQSNPARRVALKLLSAVMAAGEREGRFRHEIRMLARLRHHGIAQVFEAGLHVQETPYGAVRWPYFAMEYVDGARTLAAWANETVGRPESESLRAILAVCDAVQHAHERGVVHRDLKPQNVLVGAAGEIKVIDFGIARSVVAGEDDASRGLTRTGELLGTLHYMSPEQVRGDKLAVDTRTDVHALGVVAFELLTGRLPFDIAGRSLPEVGRILCDVEPRALRQSQPGADPDLELILATAMAKDAQRRYATAGALAEDLRRYLRHEPINARAPSLTYQLRMLARRRRGLMWSLAAIVLVSTVLGVTSLAYAYRARDAELRAVTEGEQKTDAMRRVFAMAMRSVLELPQRLEGAAGATELRRDLIEKAVQQLQFVERSAPIDPPMRRSLARAYCELGEVQGLDADGHVGDRQGAAASFERGCEHLELLLAADPADHEALLLLANLEIARGGLAFDTNLDLRAAAARWQAAAAAIERAERLPAASRRDLQSVQVAHFYRLGHLALARGQRDEAVSLLRRAHELRKQWLGGRSPDATTAREIAGLLRSIASIEEGRRDYARALAAYHEAIAVLRFAEDRPDDVAARQLLAMVRTQLGYMLSSQGAEAEGEAHMRWAYLELERLALKDGDNTALQTALGSACQRLADHLSIQARYAESAVEARQLWSEAHLVAARGLAVSRPLRSRSRDMMTVFLVGECERIEALCAEALR